MGATLGQASSAFNYRGYALVGREIVTNQPGQTQWQLVYEGINQNIYALAGNLYNKGARCNVELHGGVCRLTAVFGADPGTSPEDASNPTQGEVPQDRFDLVWEPEQRSIFNIPKVIREAEGFQGSKVTGSASSAGAVYNGPARYKYLLETAAKNGEDNPLDADVFPVADFLWKNYLSKGIDYWEGVRPVVRRIREYSLTYDINKPTSQVTITTPVYTRAKLIAAFAIPQNFANKIPLDPTDSPPHTAEYANAYVFGWRFRSYSYGYDVGTRRVVENSEWDFGEWSRGLYTVNE